MQIIQHPNEFHIRIPFNSWRVRNLDAVKSLSKRRFDPVKKMWVAPNYISVEVLKLVQTHRAELLVVEKQQAIKIEELPELPTLDFEIPLSHPDGFGFRPYQNKGVARGIQMKRFINGDEQGLGKTLQSIGTIHGADLKGEKTFPCLVVCPSSTKINWQREWKQWAGRTAIVLDNKNKNTWHRFYEMGMADVFITNYESMKKFFVDSMPPKGKMRNSMDIKLNERTNLFKSIIIDESHRCKDTKTQQTKFALRIAMGKDWRILLTGTPVVNKPMDLYPQLAIMGHLNKFGGSKGFKMRYCEGGSGAANLKELNFLLNKHCFFRREKIDVAQDLPDKQRQTILCDITTRNEYNKAKNQFVKYLEEKGWDDKEIAKKLRGEIMVKMGELKRISALGKLAEVREFVKEVMDSGEKLIVFCSLHAIVDAMLKEFPEAVTVTGRDSMDQKQESIDAFQNNPDVKLIVCNIKAAGVGITLTASSRVAFIEYPWTYSDCVQCEDRAHRIGQKNNVMCTYFLGQNTIDEKMFEMIQAKASTANAITGATDEMKTDFIDNVMDLFKS